MRLPSFSLLAPAALLAFAPLAVEALGQRQVIKSSCDTPGFPLVSSSSGGATPIIHDPTDSPSVVRAVKSFGSDLEKVTGQKPEILSSSEGIVNGSSMVVVVGSLESQLIQGLVSAGKLNVSGLTGQWEAFQMTVVDQPLDGVDKALVIVGSDRRGTIYGLYDLSEQSGVSPWYWWSDVPIKHHDELYFCASSYEHGAPSVQYRGFFLNDEQPGLTNWAKYAFKTNDTITFTHEFYEHVYELILRLKANFFWPAMWNAQFARDDPLNLPLADEYGVIYGTSHQEPMSRSTPEWWALGKAGMDGSNGKWNYSTNGAFLDKFWTESVNRSKNFETLTTVGMRGDGDLPLPGANIKIIEGILADQRRILANVTGKAITDIPQSWCLYKEVQGYYEDGLQVPDDVILLWTDDNWGNIRRVPTEMETSRPGGAGMYFHFDYVGDPRDFKWLNTISIAKTWEQLHKTFQAGATKQWIVNVGDLKPLEVPMNFYFEYAYDVTRWNEDNLDEYLYLYAAREWGDATASKAAAVISTYMHLISRQKPELNSPTTYSIVDFREDETVTEEWANLTAKAWDVYNCLDASAQSSFFQLVLHPVRAVYTVILINIKAGQNNLRTAQARMSANVLASEVHELFAEDARLMDQYHSVSDGKWNHYMDQTHLGYAYWQQPMANTLPPLGYMQERQTAISGQMRIGIEGTKGAWPGDNVYQCAQGYNCPAPTLPFLSPYGPKSRYIDIAQGAASNWTWTAAPNATYLALSKTSGVVHVSDKSTWESRVEAHIPDWSKVPEGTSIVSITVNSTSDAPSNFPDGLPVSFVTTVKLIKTSAGNFTNGFIEADGGVSMEAAHASRNTTVGETKWKTIPGYSSRSMSGGVTLFPVVGSNFTLGSGPKVEYDFYTFAPAGNVTVNLYMGTTLNHNPGRPLKYGVDIDGASPQLIAPVPAAGSAGSNPPDWNDVVAMGVRISSTNHTISAPGKHTLSIWGVEQGVVLEKIVITTDATLATRKSYLGMPESTRV